MEFVTSDKGKEKLIFEGYVYVKQKNLVNGVVSFECERRRYKEDCKAKLKVKDETVVGRLHEHTHAPDASRREVLQVIQAMKKKAEDSEETPQQVIAQSVTTMSQSTAANLPTVHVIRRNLRRCRQRVGNPIPVPLSTEEFLIPDRYKVTADGQEFLLHDSGQGNKRILLFGTHENLHLLESSQHWFLDGTFKTAPILFTQLYTIHAFINNRTVQENGLQARYQEDSDFSLKLRMIPALAFIPTDKVIDAFQELSDFLPDDTRPILDYFEDNYIGRPHRRGRRQPIFSLELWNMYDRAEAELPKTNNFVEGWHRSFKSNVGSSHPNLWKFIGFIQREQALQQVNITQALAGHAPQTQRKKYADLNSRILSLVRNYHEKSTLEYLQGIAHNIRL